MGNSHRVEHEDETASEIVKQKQEIQFVQGDFIREIEGNIESEYDILSPPMRKNEFYELRKIIHRRTKLAKIAFIINKYKVRTQQRELLQSQITKLKKMDNPFLLKIYELYKDTHRFYIVSEYCDGQSLSRILENEGAICERQAAKILYQLLYVLSDCHRNNIVHSDLKLQNIIFNSAKQNVIKVTDFSISRVFRIEDIIDQSYQKAFLAAPERLEEIATPKSDIWSCGIILFILLTRQLPYPGNSLKKMKYKLSKYKVNVNQEKLQMFSKQCRYFLLDLLRLDPAQRPTAQQCLQHSWFQKYYTPPQISFMTLKRTLTQYFNFNSSSKLQEATWNFYVNTVVSFEERQMILEVFVYLDLQRRGQLCEEDIFEGFAKFFQKQKAKFYSSYIFSKRKHRSIKFSEFVSFCTNRNFLINEENTKKIFWIFDEDKSGEISVGELKAVLGASKEVSEDIWLQLMKEADENADGYISMEQFTHLIGQLKNIENQSLVKNFENQSEY